MADKSVWFVEDNFRTLMLILITRYLFIVIIIDKSWHVCDSVMQLVHKPTRQVLNYNICGVV